MPLPMRATPIDMIAVLKIEDVGSSFTLCDGWITIVGCSTKRRADVTVRHPIFIHEPYQPCAPINITKVYLPDLPDSSYPKLGALL
jgi:hypothetical protein